VGLFIRYRDESSVYLQFKKDTIRLGTDQACDLVLRNARGLEVHHCVLTYANDAWRVEAVAEILVDGRVLAAGATARVADGATLSVGEYMVDLAFDRAARGRVTLDEKERQLLAAIAAKDHASREIYADWLEEQDQRDKSAYIRTQLQIFADPHAALVFDEARDQLCQVAERLDPRWRRSLAQLPIENCFREASETPCPGDWSALGPTREPHVRVCTSCPHPVYYCSNIVQACDYAERKHPVVVDVAEPRTPHDLDEAVMRGKLLRISR